MRSFRQVFVIQCRSNGKFISDDLNFVTGLRHAGRLYDMGSAVDTAVLNLAQDFDIVSFYEPVP